MKKTLCFIMMSAILLVLCSCMPFNSKDDTPVIDPTAVPPQTAEELYSYYNQVQRGMTRADVEALFGQGSVKTTDDGEAKFTSYLNQKKSAGVNIIYAFDDTVRTKILYYNKSQDLVPFSSEFKEDKIPQLKDKMHVSKAEEVFGGKPLEIACEFSKNSPTSYSKILSWFNADGSNFQIHTDNDLIKQRVLNVAPNKR